MDIEPRNYTKVRVLLHLQDMAIDALKGRPSSVDKEGHEWGFEPMGEASAWRCPVSIAYATGVNSASLYVILKRWREHHWGYVSGIHFSAEQMNDSRPHWLYKINAKGESYLARLSKWYKYIAEAQAANIAEGDCDTYDMRHMPRCLSWHVKPSEWATNIQWPFARKYDCGYAVWHMMGYEVANADEAVYMARSVYGIKPSKECLEQALQYEQMWVKDALDKLAKNAGFSTVSQ